MVETVVSLDMKEWDTFLHLVFTNFKRAQKLLGAAARAYAFRDIIDHFRSENGPAGNWKPRSPVTQHAYAMINSGQWKPPRGYSAGSFKPSNKILQLTGFLRQSIVPANTKLEGSNAIRIFSTDEKSGAHDSGTKNMPKRSFMWLSDAAQEKMAVAILKMVTEEGLF